LTHPICIILDIACFACGVKWSLDPTHIPFLEFVIKVDDFLMITLISTRSDDKGGPYQLWFGLHENLDGSMHPMITLPDGNPLGIRVDKSLCMHTLASNVRFEDLYTYRICSGDPRRISDGVCALSKTMSLFARNFEALRTYQERRQDTFHPCVHRRCVTTVDMPAGKRDVWVETVL
jgi:hypothetical protein